MERPSAAGLLGVLLAVLAVQSVLMFGKGVLLLDQHEGDAIHILEIVMRMAQGQWPHVDFMTPLGLLSFAPIVWLMSLGLGAGHAIMGSFVLFGVIMVPAIWWAARTRLTGWLAYAFGAMVIVLITALVYGGNTQVASISMYYNRWCWAVSFVLVVMAVLPSRGGSDTIDGVIFGLGLAFLALAKITFFVAFLPGILLALIVRGQGRALLAGLIAGLVVVAVVTLVGGVDFWSAYIGDLLQIQSGPLRAAPSDPMSQILGGPGALAMNVGLLAAIMLLRQAGQKTEGLVLLLFAPGFLYVTYQNWGNDPKWLILLAVIMLAARPDRMVKNALGWDVGRAMQMVGVLSFALILPSVFNLSIANIRHARLDRSAFVMILPDAVNRDIAMRADRMFNPARRQAFALTDAQILAELGDKIPAPKQDTLFGQPLPFCRLQMGLVGMMQQMAHDLDKMGGLTGKSVFVTDTFSSLWLFGDTAPVKGGAPWYYGDKKGILAADYILVPLCPTTHSARTLALKDIAAAPKLHLREVMRNDLYVLLQRLPD